MLVGKQWVREGVVSFAARMLKDRLSWILLCQSARNWNPGSAFKKDPDQHPFVRAPAEPHPSVPAHASDEPARGAVVKNGRCFSGRPQGLFLMAASTAA